MGSFPMWVSFVWPFPRSSKMVTSYAPSMASCSIPNCAGSTLFPFESEKYMEETIFSCRTISWYSTTFQPSCPSGEIWGRGNMGTEIWGQIWGDKYGDRRDVPQFFDEWKLANAPSVPRL